MEAFTRSVGCCWYFWRVSSQWRLGDKRSETRRVWLMGVGRLAERVVVDVMERS